MLRKDSFNLFVIIINIIRNLISCIGISRDVVVFTRYRMSNMTGELSQCRNSHQAAKPGVAF